MTTTLSLPEWCFTTNTWNTVCASVVWDITDKKQLCVVKPQKSPAPRILNRTQVCF